MTAFHSRRREVRSKQPMTSWFTERLSLKSKITLVTLAVFLGSLWSLTFYMVQALHRDMERDLGGQQFSTVSMMADQINQELDRRIESLQLVAKLAAEPVRQGSFAAQTFLDQRPDLQQLFTAGIFILNKNADRVASTPNNPRYRGINYADRDYAAGALLGGKPTIGKPVVGRSYQRPVVMVSVPIRNGQQQIIGALVGAINLAERNFLDNIMGSRQARLGDFWLVSPRHDIYVSSTGKDWILLTSR